jgi:hypothetical protein
LSRLSGLLGRRSPWVAALLNFLAWGSGFIYAGRRVLLGASLMLFTAAMFFASALAGSGRPAEAFAAALAGYLLVSLALAREAYLEARRRSGGG